MDGFIVLGTINAIACKDFFPLIKEGKVKTGVVFNKTLQFKAPSGEFKDMIGISWFTTFAVENKRPLLLTAKYDPDKYPKYDNYDAIEVRRVKDIPIDYDGVMGVPISFLDKYCPTQFEIVSASDFCVNDIEGWKGVSEEFYKMYYEQGNKGHISVGWPLPHYIDNGKAVIPYGRIFIRRVKKTVENHGKKFIIIGNGNAVTYKEIFPLIKENKIWYGVTMYGCQQSIFVVPQTTTDTNTKFRLCDGEMKYSTLANTAAWFTNLPVYKYKEPLVLTKTYDPEKYPKYDNYDAIEVGKVDAIPSDYNGIMGVPISFLGKYCPSQFEIVDARDFGLTDKQKAKSTMLIKDADSAINGKPTYARILIRKKPQTPSTDEK